MGNDPHSVLGVAKNADKDAIRDAYHKLAKRYHPDLHPNSPFAARKMNEINIAYDALRKAQVYPEQAKKRQYDNTHPHEDSYTDNTRTYSSHQNNYNDSTSSRENRGFDADPPLGTEPQQRKHSKIRIILIRLMLLLLLIYLCLSLATKALIRIFKGELSQGLYDVSHTHGYYGLPFRVYVPVDIPVDVQE
jgi:hypothetical protein